MLGAAFLITIFTVLCDPFGFAGWPWPDLVSRPGRQDRDRFIKPWDIIIQQPETLVFGTSRVKEAFNPETAPKVFGRTYNAGIDGATPSEIVNFLKFSTRYDLRLKTAIIELFFFHFVGPF